MFSAQSLKVVSAAAGRVGQRFSKIARAQTTNCTSHKFTRLLIIWSMPVFRTMQSTFIVIVIAYSFIVQPCWCLRFCSPTIITRATGTGTTPHASTVAAKTREFRLYDDSKIDRTGTTKTSRMTFNDMFVRPAPAPVVVAAADRKISAAIDETNTSAVPGSVLGLRSTMGTWDNINMVKRLFPTKQQQIQKSETEANVNSRQFVVRTVPAEDKVSLIQQLQTLRQDSLKARYDFISSAIVNNGVQKVWDKVISKGLQSNMTEAVDMDLDLTKELYLTAALLNFFENQEPVNMSIDFSQFSSTWEILANACHLTLADVQDRMQRLAQSLELMISPQDVALTEDGRLNQATVTADETNDSPERLQALVNLVKTSTQAFDSTMVANSTAQFMLIEYFDQASRLEGPVITRQGAGRIQQTLLKGLLDVSAVKYFQGAVIFNTGSHREQTRDTAAQARLIEERFQASDFRDEVSYMLVMDEPLPDPDSQDFEASLLMGPSPSLVVYPKAWNTTLSSVVRDPNKDSWRKVLSGAALTTALLYVVDRTGALQPDSEFLRTGAVPTYLLPLIASSSVIHSAAAWTEWLVARTKNITVSQASFPSFSGILFNFGHRSVYLDKPCTRADLFDTALSGLLTSFTLSAVAIAAGLQHTSGATADVVSTWPSIPVSLLQVNTFIAQVFLPKFGELYGAFNPSSGTGGLLAEPQVHLHWLALVGITSFVAATLQLIPLGNSAGSKLLYATFGREIATNVSAVTAFMRLVFYMLMAFNVGNLAAGGLVSKAHLLVDYLIVTQLLSNENEAQMATDNWTGVGQERKNLFFVLVGVLVISFFPYHFLSTQFNTELLSIVEYAKQLLRA